MYSSVLWPAMIAAAAAYPAMETGSLDLLEKRNTPFKYSVLGDSYASGVTYAVAGRTNYDDNSSGCMRINHAYGVQLLNELSKITFGYTPELNFAACSGSQMHDIEYDGRLQMKQVPEDTKLITLQIGGNDAGFFDIATNCIFHQGKDNYGEYPGGMCGASLDKTRKYIHGAQDAKPHESLWVDMHKTLSDVLDDVRVKGQPTLVYVLGYAHFWDTRPGSDWCDRIAFGAYGTDNINQHLVHGLRADMNTLTSDMNSQIQAIVSSFNSPKLRYISTTEAFDGHRFCQAEVPRPGSSDVTNKATQYDSDDVWFWNIDINQIWSASDPAKQTEADKTFDGLYLVPNPDAAKQKATYDWSDVLKMDKGVSAKSPSQDGQPGSVLRPFHPKERGHNAVMKIVLAQFKKDFYFPGQPSAPVCNPAFEGHKDMHQSDLISWSAARCLGWMEGAQGTKTELGPDDPPQGATINGPSDSKAGMRFVVSWIPGCVIEGDGKANVYYPMGNSGLTCPDIFKQDYQKCNNGGVGGYTDVGCLRYRYDGGV